MQRPGITSCQAVPHSEDANRMSGVVSALRNSHSGGEGGWMAQNMAGAVKTQRRGPRPRLGRQGLPEGCDACIGSGERWSPPKYCCRWTWGEYERAVLLSQGTTQTIHRGDWKSIAFQELLVAVRDFLPCICTKTSHTGPWWLSVFEILVFLKRKKGRKGQYYTSSNIFWMFTFNDLAS